MTLLDTFARFHLVGMRRWGRGLRFIRPIDALYCVTGWPTSRRLQPNVYTPRLDLNPRGNAGEGLETRVVQRNRNDRAFFQSSRAAMFRALLLEASSLSPRSVS